ncbi:MAG: LpqN/LpqT family lipoprotein [Planctomycetes bacterium]|nr:LpqN/LpqT family lipoprotein [Planctomycetota bacterium]
MKITAKSVMVLLTCMVPLAGCGGGGPQRTYKDTAKRFGLDVPSDWVQVNMTAMGVAAAFKCPQEENGFSPNVNVVVLPSGGLSDASALLKAALPQVRQFNGYSQLQAEVVKHANGNEAYLILADHQMFQRPLRMKQYGFIRGNKQYVITATMPVETSDTWMPQLDAILDSFVTW